MEIHDLGVAAYLICRGFDMTEFVKNPVTKRATFVFKKDGRKGDIAEIENQYWNEVGTVVARNYFDNIRMLKNRIHSQ